MIMCVIVLKTRRLEGSCEKCSRWWMIFPSFLRFDLVPPKRLLVAFDFDFFLPAVVVGIVVTGTEIRAQAACMSAKAAAACEYRAVAGCVDTPTPPNPTPPSRWCHNPPNPSPPLGSWSASVLPPAAQSPLLSSHNRKPLLCLFFKLHAVIFSPVTLIHERHLRRGPSVSVGSHWPGKERLSLWTVELWTWRHCGRSRCA